MYPGDPLHLQAAEVLVILGATADRLQERVYQLEAIARLNGETIRGMQQAAAELERNQWSRTARRPVICPPLPVTRITDAASTLSECALIGVCVVGKVLEYREAPEGGTLIKG